MSELLTICEQIVNKATDDEQIEVVAVYGKETEVRAYEGEIESLTTAESQGVGIRVVKMAVKVSPMLERSLQKILLKR